MKRKGFGNKSKDVFLNSIPVLSLESGDINVRCKFNFSYFDRKQTAGQDFSDWNHGELIKLMDKLKNYSVHPLDYWRNQRCGSGGLKILEIYGLFPGRSDFTHPQHVPHDVAWARFRLENMVRLIGFVIPRNYSSEEKNGISFDFNTFYVVFLDREHKFYKSETS